jgi:hypothetical protein
MMTNVRNPWRALVFAVIASAVLAGCATTAGPTAEQIQNARTPTDHRALAGLYEREASGARWRASDHDKMAKAYGPVQSHCRDLVKSFETLAGQYDDLASYHRSLAEGSKPQ